MKRCWQFFAIVIFAAGAAFGAEAHFEAGFAKVDVTPKLPLRLSGYSGRSVPFVGIETPLSTRAMALRAGDGPLFVLVSLDTIGVSETVTRDLAARLEKKFGIPHKRFVVACSHCHTTPNLTDGITNIFRTPLSDQERKNMRTYTEHLKDAIVKAVSEAIADLGPAKLSVGRGKVGFAMNRRIIKSGTWQGMAPNPNGAVDHSVSVLKITDADGNPRGVVFNYACHAVTLTPSRNKINADWPGYAAGDLEETYPGLTALCTIGCGADANPEPRADSQSLAHAKAHGRAMALEVKRLIEQELTPITAAPTAAFGHADLPFDVPTVADLKADLESGTPQIVRRAKYYLDVIEKRGRIRPTYPMPIEAWRFGDQLTMVFLGGEVVVDYALRLKKELPGKFVWVTAYANDVFGYVASERLRSQGGYEVDYSMIFYNLPGRWSSGTEEIVIHHVHQIVEASGPKQSPAP